jgi:hypothetical protein
MKLAINHPSSPRKNQMHRNNIQSQEMLIQLLRAQQVIKTEANTIKM